MMTVMSDSGEILGGLPRSRPQRRSARRPRPVSAAVPDSDLAGAATRRARPAETAHGARAESAAPSADADAGGSPDPVEVVTTAVRAVGELAEIGLSVGTQALRGALERLPRP